MKVAVVGATGLVGTKMLQILEERNFPITKLFPVASERSVGKTVKFRGKRHKIIGMDEAVGKRPDVAIFSAGGRFSKEWARGLADGGTMVIVISSVWRRNPNKKLIVPELNETVLQKRTKSLPTPIALPYKWWWRSSLCTTNMV